MKRAWITARNKLSAIALLLLIIIFPFSPAQALTGHLNVNTATFEELQQLPFIGATRARAIIDHRRKNGGFRNLDDLRNSEAIGESTFEAIRPYLVLTGPTTLRRNEKIGVATAGVQPEFVDLLTHRGEIRLLADADYFDTLLHHIRQAEYRIDLSMFIFKITDSPRNRPAILLEELTAASKRGVDVRILLERSEAHDELNRENYKVGEILRRKGVKVTFDNPKRTNHTKLVVVDGRYSFVGSHNLTHAALAQNSELSLLIDNRQLAEELRNYISGLENKK
jgi:competence ComEA-like helix-hairpin-helix protein